MHRTALLLLFLAACLGAPRAVRAQVRHCTAADGSVVYTDRKCGDIGATERVAPSPMYRGSASGARYRNACARTVQDLVHSFSNALQSGDANQVAGVYDWAGMPTSSAYQVMSRLDAIARRPLVDVQPVYAGGTNAYGDDVIEFDEGTGEVLAKPQRKPRLIGLRVEQTLANGSTPSRTHFGLRQRMGCWWVRL
ncbi:MAG TPA: hypothetical protein VLC71_01355 [Thermomonas sp.]|nr:hypothetical protein [Thermomonas sp.]